MAKVGEGDERWIVKEREDGKNCNGWHWSETNLTEWSKGRLTELLTAIVVLDDSSGKCKISELEKCTGDVTVQSRKQKKFPLYELEITLKWEGQLWDADGKTKCDAKGKVKIPDLSEESYDDLEMTVTVEEETNAKRELKEVVRKKGATLIREACLAFVKELKENVGQGRENTLAKKAPPTERVNNTYVVSSSESSKTGQLKISYDFVPPPHVIFDTLLDTNRMRGCTASDASMSREVGGKFSMFSGAVDGENVDLRPFSESSGDALIKWKWRFSTRRSTSSVPSWRAGQHASTISSGGGLWLQAAVLLQRTEPGTAHFPPCASRWQPGHYSTVTITLTDKDGATKLELVQVGVPEEEKERTEKGWKGLLFDRMKAMLGGSVMN